MRRNGLTIQEKGAEGHASLEDAQDAALPLLADALAHMIRSGLDRGQYIVENGVVKLRQEVGRE